MAVSQQDRFVRRPMRPIVFSSIHEKNEQETIGRLGRRTKIPQVESGFYLYNEMNKSWNLNTFSHSPRYDFALM